jgi:hypothetical protein
MRIKVRGTAEGAAVDIITPGQGGPESDQIVQSVAVTEGNELLLNMPGITQPSDIEYGNVVSASGEPAPPAPPASAEGGDVGGGNEGSADQPPAPGGDGGTPTGAEGEGGGAPAGGDQGDTPTPPTTSAASEKPLYLVDGDTVPEGFSESGLETPDGKTLFHFRTDVAGGPSSGNADGVSVYAESAENDKPVVAAAPSA